MEKIITARHFNIHDEARNVINDRLGELETEYRNLTSARVVLDKQRSMFSTEVVIHGGHVEVDAAASAKDPVFAFDKAFEKAEKQLRKHKEKLQNHKCTPLSQLECVIEELEMEKTEEAAL